MSADDNKALIRRLFAAHCRQDVEAAVACFSPDAVNHDRRVGREGMEQVYRAHYTTFPDYHWEEKLLVAEGPWVTALVLVSGTHLGIPERRILADIAPDTEPTGKRWEALHAHFYRIEDGLIVEHEAVRDDWGVVKQLGLQLPTSNRDRGAGQAAH